MCRWGATNELSLWPGNQELLMSIVTEIPAAPADLAQARFEAEFSFETDCWDVHSAVSSGERDFVLLDVRGHDAFERGHVPTAISLPHGKIIGSKLADYPLDILFVVYCAGPHCNGATRAAVRLAKLGRPVKLMRGGVTGWIDEGFHLVSAQADE